MNLEVLVSSPKVQGSQHHSFTESTAVYVSMELENVKHSDDVGHDTTPESILFLVLSGFLIYDSNHNQGWSVIFIVLWVVW